MPGEQHCVDAKEETSLQRSITPEDQKLLEELKYSKRNEAENQSFWGKLQAVPEIMRKNENTRKYFEPREISFGPIHAGDANLSKRELKVKLASRFIKDSEKPEAGFLEIIKNNIHSLRRFFGKGIADSYTDDRLARLLFLDGCALLQFIRFCFSDNLKSYGISSSQENLIKQDLFLFENQIPFQVLKLLIMINEKCKAELGNAIVQLVCENNICAPTNELDPGQMSGVFDRKNPDHLLDLLRMVSVFGSINEDIEENEDVESLLRSVLIPPKKKCLSRLPCFDKQSLELDNQNNEMSMILSKLVRVHNNRTVRNVRELKSSGIKMMPSDSPSLRSVSFSTHCFGFRGRLKLPALVVNNSTVGKLLNLVAYETCLDVDSKRRVTSYLHFLDLLIDTKQDVKDLRAACILRNHLSSDGEVTQLFNSIGLTDLISIRNDYYHVGIKAQIEDHYKQQCSIWLAQVYNDYFSNPVTIIALIAAAAGLILTFVSTWYAIYPRE